MAMNKFVFLLLFFTSFIHAQEPNTQNREDTTIRNIFKISAGIGSTELFNLGIGYRHNRLQIMVSYGTDGTPLQKNLTTHISYYFERSFKFHGFIRVAITYEIESISSDQNFLTLFMGGDWRISDKFRFDFGAGITTQILPYEPYNSTFFTLPFVPAASINIYYQFLL